MKVAVSGASGWIGSHLVSKLEEQGYDVFRLVRRAERKRDRYFDLESENEIDPSLLTGLNVVIHCAGLAHRSEASTCDERSKYIRINGIGTQRLLGAAEKAGVERFVYLSTVALYKWIPGVPATEGGPLQCSTAYAQSKRMGEEAVERSELDWRICRLATVVGVGDRGNFVRMSRAMRSGRFVIPRDNTAKKSLVGLDFALERIISAASKDTWSRKIVNVAAARSYTLGEICSGFSEVCEFKDVTRAPTWTLRVLAGVGTGLSRCNVAFPLNRVILAKLMQSTEVSTDRLRELEGGCEQVESFSDLLRRYRNYYRDA
jgi:nucleoside-diphosphate-sugar epimerase